MSSSIPTGSDPASLHQSANYSFAPAGFDEALETPTLQNLGWLADDTVEPQQPPQAPQETPSRSYCQSFFDVLTTGLCWILLIFSGGLINLFPKNDTQNPASEANPGGPSARTSNMSQGIDEGLLTDLKSSIESPLMLNAIQLVEFFHKRPALLNTEQLFNISSDEEEGLREYVDEISFNPEKLNTDLEQVLNQPENAHFMAKVFIRLMNHCRLSETFENNFTKLTNGKMSIQQFFSIHNLADTSYATNSSDKVFLLFIETLHQAVSARAINQESLEEIARDTFNEFYPPHILGAKEMDGREAPKNARGVQLLLEHIKDPVVQIAEGDAVPSTEQGGMEETTASAPAFITQPFADHRQELAQRLLGFFETHQELLTTTHQLFIHRSDDDQVREYLELLSADPEKAMSNLEENSHNPVYIHLAADALMALVIEGEISDSFEVDLKNLGTNYSEDITHFLQNHQSYPKSSAKPADKLFLSLVKVLNTALQPLVLNEDHIKHLAAEIFKKLIKQESIEQYGWLDMKNIPESFINGIAYLIEHINDEVA